MQDLELQREIEALCVQYEYNWGKEVDMLILPKGISQEKLCKVLYRIVETGESVLVGYNKLFLTY